MTQTLFSNNSLATWTTLQRYRLRRREREINGTKGTSKPNEIVIHSLDSEQCTNTKTRNKRKTKANALKTETHIEWETEREWKRAKITE